MTSVEKDKKGAFIGKDLSNINYPKVGQKRLFLSKDGIFTPCLKKKTHKELR